jgi:hypothetical protein
MADSFAARQSTADQHEPTAVWRRASLRVRFVGVSTLTPEAVKAMASAAGLTLSDEEIARILPLVQGHRSLMQSVRDALSPATEPVIPGPT